MSDSTPITIAFPRIDVSCGFPPLITLTACEARAMARIHLGGIEALRTPKYKVACRTVDSLFKKGLLEKAGVTVLGRRVARILAEQGLV